MGERVEVLLAEELLRDLREEMVYLAHVETLGRKGGGDSRARGRGGIVQRRGWGRRGRNRSAGSGRHDEEGEDWCEGEDWTFTGCRKEGSPRNARRAQSLCASYEQLLHSMMSPRAGWWTIIC